MIDKDEDVKRSIVICINEQKKLIQVYVSACMSYYVIHACDSYTCRCSIAADYYSDMVFIRTGWIAIQPNLDYLC